MSMKNSMTKAMINTRIQETITNKSLSHVDRAVCINFGYASDRLTADDFDSKQEYKEYSGKVDNIKTACYNLFVARKNHEFSEDKADTVYTFLKVFFKKYDFSIKCNGETAEYLSTKSVKSGFEYSDDIKAINDEIKEYRKQEREAKHKGLFQSEIDELTEKKRLLCKLESANKVKTDVPVSTNDFRKILENYIAFRLMGLADDVLTY